MNNYQGISRNLALGAAAIAVGLLWVLVEMIDFPLGMPAFGVGTVPGIGQALPTSMPSTRPLAKLLEA